MELIINVLANENGTISVSGSDEQLNNANEKQRAVLEAVKNACSKVVGNSATEAEENYIKNDKEIIELIKRAYDTGYSDGYKGGYDDGFDGGFDDGFDDGYTEGYYDGYEYVKKEQEEQQREEESEADRFVESLTKEELDFLDKEFPTEEVLKYVSGEMSPLEMLEFHVRVADAFKKLGR